MLDDSLSGASEKKLSPLRMAPGSHDDDVDIAIGGELGHDLGGIAPLDHDFDTKSSCTKGSRRRFRGILRKLVSVLD